MGLLDGKVAIVTGAARGTGEVTARRFVEEGAKVVLADIRDDLGERVAGELGDAAHYVHLDVTSESDWRGAVSLVTGFVAKEVVVSSMGVLYAVGDDVDEEDNALRDTLRRFFTPLSAFAFMLFVLLYTPCVVALVTVIRELKNWRWSVFSVAYQILFAWGVATVVFQAGKLIGLK